MGQVKVASNAYFDTSGPLTIRQRVFLPSLTSDTEV